MLWSRGLASSRGKQKPLFLYYQSAYGRQTWQDDDLRWWAPNYKAILDPLSRGLAKQREKLKSLYF